MLRRSRRSLLLGVFLGCIVTGYFALSFAQDGRVPPNVVFRPTAMPDRVVLTWSDDPSTTQSVTWRTDTSVRQPVAQLAEAGDGPDFTKSAVPLLPETESLTSDLGDALYHTARFRDLTPDTIYAYRVGDGVNWSEWNHFRTASSGAAPLTFLYVGDAQNDILEHWSRVIRTAFQNAPDARFIVHAGDLVNRGDRDAEWGEWFRAAGWIDRVIPMVPTPGNHEYSGDQEGLTRHWRPTFALPSNGLEGLEESCYYLDVQGVRIISLNSNERHEEQAVWLDGVLANNPSRWTILTYHHPMYSAARGRDNKRLREMWQPVIDKHHVDLVLQGHDHTYARSNLVQGADATVGPRGTVYVVSVSGPKQYEVDRQPWMQRAASHTQLFQTIRIDGDTLEYEARTARGILYDAFDLRKRLGAANELVNKAPISPERLAESGD